MQPTQATAPTGFTDGPEVQFTTEQAFKHPVPPFRYPGDEASTTNVAQRYVNYYCGFQMREWKSFCSEASRYLVGENKRTLSRRCKGFLDFSRELVCNEALGEAQTASNVYNCFLLPVNSILASLSWDEAEEFRCMHEKFSCLGKTRLRPDYVLAPRSKPAEPDRPFVVVEVKTPPIKVGASLEYLRSAVKSLQEDGDFSDKARATLYAFLQVFSYCGYAKTCYAFLTNYKESRFIHIRLSEKVVFISDVVKHNQLWNMQEQKPHVHQAILYLVHAARNTAEEESAREEMESVIYGDSSYEGHGINGNQGDSGFRRITRSMRRRQGFPTGGGGGGSSFEFGQSGTYQTPKENSSFNIYRFLRQADTVPVGYGLTGSVLQSKTENNVPVVLKSANFEDPECMEHVKNEIKMYEQFLAVLQGSVIPKMIGWCYERRATSGTLFLVTEKVGSALCRHGREEREIDFQASKNGLYVDDVLLDDANVSRLTRLSLKGLKEFHGRNILHGDIRYSNLRVTLCKGTVCKVWWIDFGLSEYSEKDALKKKEEAELISLFDRPVIPVSPI